VVGIAELRVGDQRLLVVAALAPLLERSAGKGDRLASGVPVEIVVDDELIFVPILAKQRPVPEINDVALERETDMRLHARTGDLFLAGQREDVVPDHVLLAVVLVEAA